MPRSGEAALLELIAHAYDAGLGRKPWSVLLEALAEALGSRHTHILVLSERGRHGLVGAVRSDPEMQRQYAEYYGSINPYPSHPAAQHTPGLVHSGEWLPKAEVEKTEFYNDFLRQSDAFPCLVGNLFGDRDRKGFLATYRPFHGKPFGKGSRALLSALVPHVQRAIEVSAVFGQLEDERSSWLTSLDLLPHGMIVLDRRASPVFVNRAASRLLTSENGLIATREGLRASHPADATALAALIASALRTASSQGTEAGACLVLRRPPDRNSLAITVVPLPRRSEAHLSTKGLSRAPAAIVFVADPAPRREPEVPVALLAPLFDLTPREAEVACLLGQGLGVTEAASRLAIAFHTARVHQRRIYDKMGVHSQAELVRTLRALSPLGAEP